VHGVIIYVTGLSVPFEFNDFGVITRKVSNTRRSETMVTKYWAVGRSDAALVYSGTGDLWAITLVLTIGIHWVKSFVPYAGLEVR
jgi:hypothetical protein